MNINKYIELSILSPTITSHDIDKFCNIAIEYEYHAIVVPPVYVSTAKEIVANTNVKLVSIVDFPHGNSLISTRLDGAESIIDMGADEIDIVAPRDVPLNHSSEILFNLRSIVRVAKQVPVKIIIETGLLNPYEIGRWTELCIEAGAAYVKTSTGFNCRGATIDDIKLIKSAANGRIKIKASGGIATYQQAVDLIEAGADRIGTSKVL